MSSASTPLLPELQLSDWRATKDTLHLYCQVVGKIRLATTAPRNHWWNVPLYVDVRGLTTRRLHHGRTTFDITLDFVDHALVVRTADGCKRCFDLAGGVPVADFDSRLHGLLAELGIDVDIVELPFGLAVKTPFPEDVEHASWDRDAIERFGRVLDWSDSVFEEFSGWFNGKTSPVHLFWHSLDLAVTRFSGRRVPPAGADPVTQEAYSHEVISFGFWAGDDTIGDAAYYSYTAPEPGGLRDQYTTICAGRPTREGHCSPSARARTRQVPAWPAGIPPISGRAGARPRLSFSSSSRMPAQTWGGRPRDPDPSHPGAAASDQPSVIGSARCHGGTVRIITCWVVSIRTVPFVRCPSSQVRSSSKCAGVIA
jgi:hypothetical protein